jgi:O-glycosyl hydrolase
VQSAQSGNYTVVVNNTAGAVTSAVAVLTVTNPLPPTITTQPVSQTVAAGTNVSFTVAANGTPPFSYQWRFNGANVSGATATMYSLANVQSAQAGNYTVVVNNTGGAVTSAVAVLTVTNPLPPTITTQPVSQTVASGANVSFTVAASGTPPFTYQWQFNGANVSGATGTSLGLNGVQIANAGNYSAVVRNSVGATTSAVAVLTVLPPPGTVTVNGGITYQTIDGFGVNANHRSWNNGEAQPVLDALIDQAGMTIFHVIFDNPNWEGTNDNSDPNTMNWTYYNTIYSSPDFQQMWGMMAYLNQRGITSGLVPDFEGPAPLWMGGLTLNVGMESEFAEEIASAVVYARKMQGLQFTTVGPINEPDITATGIHMSGPSQLVTVLHDFGQLLDFNGLSDVRFSAPDLANTSTAWLSAMMGDSYVMSKLAEFGMHAYQNETVDVSGVYNFIKQSTYPNTHFWMTEYNVWCANCQNGVGGDNSWTNARGTANYLLTLLGEGASAGVVWEAYDSQYLIYDAQTGGNDGPHWSYWGLFAVNDINASPRTYTARKGFYTLSQISKFVRPGAQRINVSGTSGPLTLLAFYNSGTGQVTLTGVNTGGQATNLTCALTSLPSVSAMNLYYTSSSANVANGGMASVNNGLFSVSVPADCVFTIVSTNGGLPSALTSQPGSSASLPGSVVRPQFLTPAVQNGNVQLRLTAPANASCQIQVSTDLVTWKTVTNAASTNGMIFFTDPNAKGDSQRFYRAISAN